MANFTPMSAQEKRTMSGWLGQRSTFKLLYSAKRDGCTPQAFHQKCDNNAATMTIAYSTSGYMYGGYTSQAWNSGNGFVQDLGAFLFRLRSNGKSDPVQLMSTGKYSNVYCQNAKYTQGPGFGNGHSGNYVLLFFTSAKQTDDVITLNGMQVVIENVQHAYTNPNDVTSETFSGGTTTVYDIEVYAVTESKILPDEEPWRKMGKLDWSDKTLNRLKNEVIDYSPPECLNVAQVRMLMIGQVGAGKSSFFNTINSIFRGYVTSQAASGTVTHSLTTKYRMYEVLTRAVGGKAKGGGKLKLRLCDTMGLEADGGLDVTDFPYILDGNIQDCFQFNPMLRISSDHPDFKPDPKLADKIHLVVFVLDSSTLDVMPQTLLDKYRAIRAHVNQRGIGLAVLLTKVDKLCPETARDVTRVFHSEAVRDVVDSAANQIGVPRSHILPVKNYESEMELEDSIDIMALLGLRQMLRLADSYFDEHIALFQ